MQGVLAAQRQRVELERLAAAPDGRGPDGRFRKGFSGNPKGRPPGIRTVTARLVHAILAQNAEEITGALVVNATRGNVIAQKTCIERLLGVARGQPLDLDLALDPSTVGVAVASGRAVEAVGTGVVTPEEGADLARVIDTRRRAVEKLWAEEVAEARVIEEGTEDTKTERPSLNPPPRPSPTRGDGECGRGDNATRTSTCSPDPSPDHQERAAARFDPAARAAVRSANDRKP
jgi:hypothetical protein